MAGPFWQYDSDNTLLAFRKLHASPKNIYIYIYIYVSHTVSTLQNTARTRKCTGHRTMDSVRPKSQSLMFKLRSRTTFKLCKKGQDSQDHGIGRNVNPLPSNLDVPQLDFGSANTQLLLPTVDTSVTTRVYKIQNADSTTCKPNPA